MVISRFYHPAGRPSARQFIKVKLNLRIKFQYCLLCSAKSCAIEEGYGDKPVARLCLLSDRCSG
jgi:hypothetical protein